MPITLSGTTGITTPGMESSAMPTVGGDAVVESGSNSDGEWTRWADGTQVCRDSKVVTDQAIGAAYGSLFQGSRPVTFPMPFVGKLPSVSSSCRWGAGRAWAGTLSSDISLTVAPLAFLDIASRPVGTSFVLSWTAHGYWK